MTHTMKHTQHTYTHWHTYTLINTENNKRKNTKIYNNKKQTHKCNVSQIHSCTITHNDTISDKHNNTNIDTNTMKYKMAYTHLC